MPNRLREYHRPSDLQTALSLLQSDGHTALNLGPRPTLEPFVNSQAVVDLSALNLEYITETADTISIGAQTPLQAIVESPVLKHLASDLLSQAAQYVAHLGLRSLATLSATLTSADASPELHLALLALRAKVIVQRKQSQTISLMIYESDPDELLLEVNFSRPLNAKAAIARVARSPLDAAIVAAVAVVTPTTTLVAIGGASAKPIILQSLNFPITFDSAFENLDFISDYRGSAEYRKAMAIVLANRALAEAK